MSDGIPSPNSQFPQQIKNVTGNANENLWNILQEKAGTSVTTTDNIVYNLVPTSNYRTYDIIADENTAYTADFDLSANSSDIYIYFIYADDTQESVGYMSSGSFVSKHINKTSNSNKTLVGIKIDTYSLSTNNNYEFNKPILCKGTYTAETIPSYAPHQEQNLPFTFAEGQRLMQGGELQDDGIYNIRTQLNLKDKNWVIRQDYTDTDYVLFKQNDYETDIYKSITNCTHFPITSSTPSPAYNCIRLVKVVGYGINILIQKSIASTPEELKTWLTEQNVIVELELEQPDIIPYNETQASEYNAIKEAHTYKDVTYISGESDELPPLLDIQYWKERGAE